MLKEHPALTHINGVIEVVAPPLAVAVKRFLDKAGNSLPDDEVALLLRVGTPSNKLQELVALDYHKLFWTVMNPYLDKAYKGGAAGHRAPGEQKAFEKVAERWIPYMIREQLAAFAALARLARTTTATTDFGLSLVKAAYGLTAQDAIRAANWAITADSRVEKVDNPELERLLRAYGPTERPSIDPLEVAREQREMRLRHVRAVSHLKEERAAMIAEEEATRTYHEGRYAVEEALQAERQAISERPVPLETFPEPAFVEEERPREPLVSIIGEERWERWITHPEASATGVCPRCMPLHNMERRFGTPWPDPTAGINMPLDAGMHPRCKCTSEFFTIIDWSDGTITQMEE